MRSISLALSLLLVGVLAVPAPADTELLPSSKKAADLTILQQTPDRLIVTLPNRLVVIAQEIDTAPVVSVQCWIKTGSIFEQQHNGAGLSHFLEHLLSGGTTERRTEVESNAILGRMGAQTNAATSLDTVRYYINTASEHTSTAIDLLSDWMQHAKITEAEFARERDVIQREFDMGRGEPGRIFWKLTQQARYLKHPARHPTIGYLDEFLSISRDEIYAFYRQMYVPNNMVFVVSGDIDKQVVVNQIAELWADAEPGDLPKLSFPVEPPAESKELTGYADIQLPRLRLAWPGTRLGEEHDYAMDLLAQILGQGELSRLVKTVRDEQQLVTSIASYNLSFDWGEGFFAVDAVTTADQMDQTRSAILEQIRRIKNEGISDEELERAKSKTVAGVVYDAQTAYAAGARVARDFIGHGNPDYLDHYAEAIQQLTPDDLKAAANALLTDEHLLTLKLLPSQQEPEHMVRPDELEHTDFPTEPIDLDNRRLITMFKAEAEAGEAEHHVPEHSQTKMITLDNGLRVLLRRDTRLPIVAMQWYHLGGLLADEPGREGVTNAMATMMIKGAADTAAGDRIRTADQIARFLEERGAQLNTACGYNTIYVTAQCLAEDADEVLDLMSDVIIRPTFPADEWQDLQPRLVAAIKSIDDRWSSQMANEFNQAWFGEHPWAHTTVGVLPVVESLTVETMAEQHRKQINAPQAVLAVYGDIDLDAMQKQIAEHFAALPAEAAAPVALAEPGKPNPRGHLVQINKPMAAVQIGFGPAPTRDHEDYVPMEVLTKVVSNFPSGWLHRALRGEGKGLVYAAWGYQRTGVVPGYWTMAFNTAPAQAEQAINESMAVVERLRTQPIDDDTMARARNAALVSEMLGRQSYSQQAMSAALDELYGLGYAHADKYADEVRAVTAADVRAMAERYLSGKPMVVILSNEPIEDVLESNSINPAADDGEPVSSAAPGQ